MKCEHHPNVKAVALCDNCSTPICGICARYTENSTLCERCEGISSLSQYVDSQQRPRQSDKIGQLLTEVETRLEHGGQEALSHSKAVPTSDKVHMGIVIMSSIFIGFRIFGSLGTATMLTTDQVFAEETQRNQIESCMMVFWDIATQLAEGEDPDNSMQCAEGPMLIARNDSEVVVRHPRPDLLGFSDIYVSSTNPVPILVE